MSEPYIDNINARKAALYAALVAALPHRVVRPYYTAPAQEHHADLLKGVVAIRSVGEHEYTNDFGVVAKDPAHRFLITAHIQVAEGTTREAVEIAEGELIEEIKAFWRAGLPGMAFRPVRADQSQQFNHPLGWVVCLFDITPPTDNEY